MGGVTPEEKLLGVIKQSQRKMRVKKELKLFTKINIALISAVIILLSLLLLNVFTSTPDYNIPELKVDLPDGEWAVLPVKDNLDDELPEITVKKEVSTVSKQELIKDLNVLGIVTGDNNQAIIEDKKTNKTLFLYKGDTFGGFTVYEVKNNEVILDYNGEKINLKL